MLDSIKRTYNIIRHYFSQKTFRKMIFMLLSRSLIICGIGTLSIPAMFWFGYNNARDNNIVMLFGGGVIFLIYVVWLIWADKNQLVSYNRLFFLSEMSMQKDYILKLIRLPVDYFDKNYGISKSAALLDDGTDEVMMRFQDFVSLIFKSLAVICVAGWIFYISNIYVVILLLLVIIMEFFITEKISKKIGKYEDDSFQNSVVLENSQRVFVDNTDIYAMSGLDDYWKMRMEKQLEDVYHSRKRVVRLQNWTNVIMNIKDLSIYVFTILYGIIAGKNMLSPLVILMAYEMIKDIIIDFLNSILRIQQKLYAIKEFESINENTQASKENKNEDYKLRNVSLTAGGKLLLDDINIDIKKGSKVLIVGDNGAGKTLLLKVLSNIYGEENTDIHITGKVEVPDSAFGPVERKFFPVSVYDNINLCCERDIEHDKLQEQLSSLLKQTIDIDKEYDNYENQFSLGQMDVFGFLRTINTEKNTVILDEPFAHVDSELKQKLWDKIMNMDKTVIMVEHDYNEAVEKYNPCVIWMKSGKVLR